MFQAIRRFAGATSVGLLVLAAGSDVLAAKPSAAAALALKPLQRDIEYDRPTAEEAKSCTVRSATEKGVKGWEVYDSAGRLLRRFLDTNIDNKVDLWCYFQNGIEIYRDVDSDFNGKADQHRWLGTSGTRWGIDANEEGHIQKWKSISAEEVTEEVVNALKNRDVEQFRRLLLSPAELKQLGLSQKKERELGQKISAAEAGFKALASRQNKIKKNSKWVHFGGTRPGVVPAGQDGSTRDLTVYENVAAVVETDGKHQQVVIGTLIRVGPAWRLIDLPGNLLEGQADLVDAGYFFQASLSTPVDVEGSAMGGLSEETQKLLTALEDADKSLAAATGAKRAKLQILRADVLFKLVAATQGEERVNWSKQLADIVSAAVQTGEYPGGEKRLQAFYKQLEKDDHELAAYVKFRFLSAGYGKSLQAADADFAKVQEKWLEDLETFVEDFPQAEDSAEAMLQLALAEEFAGQDKKAIAWYARIVKDFPKQAQAAKSAGAKRRIESVGKKMKLRGVSATGKPVDVASYAGKMVVIHYWATWCGPCKEDMQILKQLQTKYARRGLAIIGVNLDNQKQEMIDFLRIAKLPWHNLHEEGGLDSRLANEMGILTLPTTILVDKKGNVVSRNIQAAELEGELKKRLR